MVRSWSSEGRGPPARTRMCSAAARCRPGVHHPAQSMPTESMPAQTPRLRPYQSGDLQQSQHIYGCPIKSPDLEECVQSLNSLTKHDPCFNLRARIEACPAIRVQHS